MSGASYRKFSYAIAAGATQLITRRGDFFHVVAADQSFSVGWDNGEQTPFFAGLEYEVPNGESFNQVAIENTSGTPMAIEVGIGSGGVRDGRFTVTGALDVRDNGGASFDEVVAAFAMPNTFTTGAPVIIFNGSGYVPIIRDANSARREIVISNEGAGTVYVTSDRDAGPGEGLPLKAGQSMTLQTSSLIRARNDSGADVPIHWAELEFA